MNRSAKFEFQPSRDTSGMRLYGAGTAVGLALTGGLYVLFGWGDIAVLFGVLYAVPATMWALAILAPRLRGLLYLVGIAPMSLVNFTLLMVVLPTPHILVNFALFAAAFFSGIQDGRAADAAGHRPSAA